MLAVVAVAVLEDGAHDREVVLAPTEEARPAVAADGLDDDAAREVLRGRVLLVDGLRRRGLLVERKVRRVARRAERAGRARRRGEVRVERVCVCVYVYGERAEHVNGAVGLDWIGRDVRCEMGMEVENLRRGGLLGPSTRRGPSRDRYGGVGARGCGLERGRGGTRARHSTRAVASTTSKTFCGTRVKGCRVLQWRKPA